MTSLEPRRNRAIAWFGLLCLVLAGCGYRFAGTGGTVFPVKVIVVVPFENRTNRPEIEQRVTEEVARVLSRRGKYEVVTDRAKADGILEGAIMSYRTSPVEFGSESRASRVEAMVTLQATLRELATDEVLWSRTGLVFREQFDVADTEQFFDEESIALDAIAEGAAGALVTAMFEDF